MPESTKQVVKARAESHSDVAESAAARAHQQTTAERQFGDQLIKHLRDLTGAVTLRNFQEEWVQSDDGLAYEISVEFYPEES